MMKKKRTRERTMPLMKMRRRNEEMRTEDGDAENRSAGLEVLLELSGLGAKVDVADEDRASIDLEKRG